jgi:hypothetical protein
VIIAVTAAMIGVAIKKPDMGHAMTVGVNIPLVKGLGPVMNIVLAYGKRIFNLYYPFPVCLK